MQVPSQPPQGDTKLAKWMIALAWIAGLGLLVTVLDDQLERQYNPNREPQSEFTSQGVEVRLKRNRMGHYVSAGTINGQPVVFMLDTGATNVSIPFHMADTLGLRPGLRYSVSTANGAVQVAQTDVAQLSLGNITLNNIDAHLNPGLQGNEILLGMSALKQLEFTQQGEWLILRSLGPSF